MTYNVENLFDTQNDPGKNDFTYLPAKEKKSKSHIAQCMKIKRKSWRDECLYLDWNETVLHQKLSQLARVVLKESPTIPDILILQEVENMNVLKQFQEKYLKKAKYKTRVLIEGDDKRGIDVAILSRFQTTGTPILHSIGFEDITQEQLADTRGILEVGLVLLGGEKIIVYANHFPAPFSPTQFREQGFQSLQALQKRNPEAFQVAAGDFNVIEEDIEKADILNQKVLPFWDVVHLACKTCKGTYYYPPKKIWNFLDMILVSKSYKGPWKIDPSSIEVVSAPWMRQKNNAPQPFEFRTGQGASDHFPLYTEFVKN